jgi:hypothetical protein
VHSQVRHRFAVAFAYFVCAVPDGFPWVIWEADLSWLVPEWTITLRPTLYNDIVCELLDFTFEVSASGTVFADYDNG